MATNVTDFTNERVNVGDDGRTLFSERGPFLTQLTFPSGCDVGGLAREDLARALAARWNACADAHAVTESPEDAGEPAEVTLERVVAILRRAIYGDEEPRS